MLILGVFFFQIREQFDSLDLQAPRKAEEPKASVIEAPARPRASDRRAHCWRCRRIARRGEGQRRVELLTLRSPPRADRRVMPTARCSCSTAVLRRSVQRVPGRPDRVRRLHDRDLLAPYMRIERDHGRLTPARLRLYHSMYPALHVHDAAGAVDQQHGHPLGGDGGGHADHGAAGSLYRTPASLEAAWKYFILCGVGIAQALFGTILLYFAAEKVLGAEARRAAVDAAERGQGQLEPTVLSLAFVFLLVGYGTKVGLVPLHNWLPDAHAEGPDAGVRRALGPAAQRRALRGRALQGAGRRAPAQRVRRRADDGLRPAVGGRRGVPAVAPERHQAPVRLFVDRAHGHHHVRVRHGRPVASFAGLLHMTVHSLTKSAIFFAVGHATQKAGTQVMDDIRGLVT
jgi:hydrogenase-4 component F